MTDENLFAFTHLRHLPDGREILFSSDDPYKGE